METPPKILIVDDEESIRLSLTDLLERDGYEVVAAESGERALDEIAGQQFDVALLDLKLEGMGGLEVLAALRQQSPGTAAIVLTAHGSMETAIEALRQGAHDYLLKPCNAGSLRESVHTALLERERQQRQQALLRQVEQSLSASLEEIRAVVVKPTVSPTAANAETTQAVGASPPRQGLVVDTAQHIITLDGHQLELSPTEFALLAYLVAQAPRVVTAPELVRQVQGYVSDRFEAADIIRHHVHRIRHKAKACAGREDVIRTVRGVGYALNGQLAPPRPESGP